METERYIRKKVQLSYKREYENHIVNHSMSRDQKKRYFSRSLVNLKFKLIKTQPVKLRNQVKR